MGFVVLLFLIVSVFGGVFTFQVMQSAFNLPIFLNVPGAFAIGFSFFAFSGWLSILSGLFNSYTMPPPDVPWYTWLVYLAVGILWYVTIITVRHRCWSITKQQNLQNWNPYGKSGVDWLR